MISKIKDFYAIVLTPVAIGFTIFALYGFKWSSVYNMMGMTFFIMFPYIVGVISILKSPKERLNSMTYKITQPWKILGIILLITMVLSLEGWACWIMLFPLLAFFSSVGGLVAGHFRLMQESQKLHISIMFLIPLILSPIESSLPKEQKIVETISTIEIQAPAKKIWDNITSVKRISKEEDKSILTPILAFPRPLEAILDKNEVGGYRKAIFTDGLIFHERVTKYKEQEEMFFTIKANTYEIPSTTFDEHLLIGGDYFNMLDGEYILIPLKNEKYKIKLISHFQVTTTFNWYAGILGELIMYDIQKNILKVIKKRSEKEI